MLTAAKKRLALFGGPAVREGLLPYGRHLVEEEDIAAVADVLRSSWITTGPLVAEFEEACAAEVDASHVVAFSSGTAALHGAAFAADLAEGDEAITTTLTFCATANCVLYQGATPVFADVEPRTLTLDPDEVRRLMGPRTKAIIPVDLAGHPANLDALMQLAEAHRCLVIEDASHALGASYRGRKIGSISHMTTFSLHPVKHVTTGEGGLVATNRGDLAERLRQFRNHGIQSDARIRQERGEWRYEMTSLGYNYRLSDMSCALGRSQLRRLSSNLARRREIAHQYAARLVNAPGIELPAVAHDADHAWHLYPIQVTPTADRDTAMKALRAEGIGVNLHYSPVHRHPYYEQRFGRRVGLCPIAESASDRLITLPMFHGMTPRDVDDVVAAVEKVFGALAED